VKFVDSSWEFVNSSREADGQLGVGQTYAGLNLIAHLLGGFEIVFGIIQEESEYTLTLQFEY